MADKKVMLTQEGYNKLVDKLNYLKSVRRIEIAERLKAAIALGDLSENSEYVDAKNEQGFLEGEIMDLEAQIHNSVIIHEEATDVVSLGSTVKILFPNGDEDTYMIVGSTFTAFLSRKKRLAKKASPRCSHHALNAGGAPSMGRL